VAGVGPALPAAAAYRPIQAGQGRHDPLHTRQSIRASLRDGFATLDSPARPGGQEATGQQLADLGRHNSEPQQDPTLLDDLPLLDPETITHAPAQTLAQLCEALDIQASYNKTTDQATIRATLTGTTPHDITTALTTHPNPAPSSSTTPHDPTRKVFVRPPVAILSLHFVRARGQAGGAKARKGAPGSPFTLQQPH
jgi:hypothetical protein